MSNPEFDTRQTANASNRPNNFTAIISNFPATNFPIGINLLDIQQNCNPRIRAYADNVAPADSNYDKFIGRINLDTWGDTRLVGARCTWLDTSKHSLDFQFGKISTGKLNGADATRARSINIQFNRPYTVAPKVIVWLTGLESDCTRPTRLWSSGDDVTTNGFKLVVNTWLGSILHDVTLTWIAVPSDNPMMTAGRIKNPIGGLSKSFQQDILFERPFKRVPRVMVALNKIDVPNTANLRIVAYPKDISTHGMRLVVETWGDTLIDSSGAGYIAIDDAPA